MQIKFSPIAEQEFNEIGTFISQKGYPETATKYGKRLIDFCYSIAILPHKYTICRHQRFARWQFRCATFEDTYIIVNKIEINQLIVKRIIHGKQIK